MRLNNRFGMRAAAVAFIVAILTATSVQPLKAQESASPAAMLEDTRLNAFLDRAFDEQANLSPQQLTRLGIKRKYGQLDDYTLAGEKHALELMRSHVAEMQRQFKPEALSPDGRLSFDLFKDQLRRAEENYRWADYRFDFTAVGSPAGDLPAFMINSHEVSSVDDAEAYVARLREFDRVLSEVAARLRARAAKGLIEPKLVFAPAIADARKVISGGPFAPGPDAPLWADFKAKVDQLQTDTATKQRLLIAGRTALQGPVKDGYETIVKALSEGSRIAESNDGVWRFPNGKAFYASRIALSTTTQLTAEEIHNIGLREMERIHREMEAVKARVGFHGTLRQFFQHIKSGARFHYPNTSEGRKQYLDDATSYVGEVMAKAPKLFGRLPKARLNVRAVEPWREGTSGIAFYNPAPPDGSRPGIFYANLSDLSQTLKPQVEAITCHEGAPGHHFQLGLTRETASMPKFRRFGILYGSFVEGWGLYSEGLCKELGLYRDPYSDFGRLSLDAWRAARLVTDTGLHAKRWSREKAIEYFQQSTLLSDLDIRREIDRYLSLPGQATSYKIGQIRISQARAEAATALGERFDLRAFHDFVLAGGAVPLDVLQQRVNAYVAAQQ